MTELKRYSTDEITVTFDAERCIHSGECTGGLPAVFDLKARPWIQPDKAAAEAVAEVVQRCPSGALRIAWKDGRAAEPVPARNEAQVTVDGPIYLRGAIELRDGAGNLIAHETRVALCRCGASRNKPYCDGSHEQVAFRDPGRFSAAFEIAAEDAGGPLQVTARSNGPLHLQGRLVIRCADGTAASSAEQCWLCRCGGSGNKPFCDGTHKKIGFED